MPTIRIDDEVWKYLQSKAKPFEDSPNDVLRRELRIDVQKVTKKTGIDSEYAHTLKERTGLVSAAGDYTNRSVSGFRLRGMTYAAQTFKEVLIGVATQLKRNYPAAFDSAAAQLRGRKRPYFSSDPSLLRHPERVPGSELFVETNLNANLIVSVCSTLAEGLGEGASFSIV